MRRSPEGSPVREHEPERFRFTWTQAIENSPLHERDGSPCEDTAFILPNKQAAGVFDGVGGRFDGHIASRLASEAAQEIINQGPENLSNPEVAEALLRRALTLAHERITQDTLGQEQKRLKGTTAVLTLVFERAGKLQASVGWVGDSRIYRVRGHELTMLTQDDANWLESVPEADRLNQQMIQASIESRYRIPKQANPHHLIKDPSIKQSLGMLKNATASELLYHTATYDLLPEDHLLLLSDGVSDVLTIQRIIDIVNSTPPADIPKRLIQQVRHLSEQGHDRRKKDDATAIDLHIQDLKAGL